jgi:hypothetical protein
MREWSTSYTSICIVKSIGDGDKGFWWLRLSDGAGIGLNSERRSRRNALMLSNYHWGLTGLEFLGIIGYGDEQRTIATKVMAFHQSGIRYFFR